MRPRTPSLDWIAKVLGESAEDRPRRSRPVLRLICGGSDAPAPASPPPAPMVGLARRRSPQKLEPGPKTGR